MYGKNKNIENGVDKKTGTEGIIIQKIEYKIISRKTLKIYI